MISDNTTATCVVVDPHPEDYLELLEVADAENWSFQFFSSARPALRYAAASSADLWLINLELPAVSGLDLLAMLRDCQAKGAICLVGNRASAALERQAVRARPTAYAVKPLDVSWFRQWRPRTTPVGGMRPAVDTPGQLRIPHPLAWPAQDPRTEPFSRSHGVPSVTSSPGDLPSRGDSFPPRAEAAQES
ncbi:MAG: hypothetical protein GTO62_02960 [Planctomycetales bacterium]|nr:hypothetical protein [Planctomycetales bacterium]NIP68179.1 hypothetical protein [Planctomycetales bacterium]